VLLASLVEADLDPRSFTRCIQFLRPLSFLTFFALPLLTGHFPEAFRFPLVTMSGRPMENTIGRVGSDSFCSTPLCARPLFTLSRSCFFSVPRRFKRFLAVLVFYVLSRILKLILSTIGKLLPIVILFNGQCDPRADA